MKIINYCPTCGSKLKPHRIKDIYLSGFLCQNGHLFYKELKEGPSCTESTKVKEIESPISNGDNDIEVIKFWLTNKKARATLNNQLAVMLRRIYEIYKNNHHIIVNEQTFKFCTICKESLEVFEQDDVWVKGKKCNNSHEFYERGGEVYFFIKKKQENLSEEMPDSILIFHVKGWLKNNPLFDEQLHSEVKGILKRFRQKINNI